jgi:hypothetical protein
MRQAQQAESPYSSARLGRRTQLEQCQSGELSARPVKA